MNQALSAHADRPFADWSRLIRASDRSALAELFRATFADLHRYAMSFGADAATADDLVQEAFIRLWDRRASIDEDQSLRAYLFVTTRHLAHNDDRRIRTRRRIHSTMMPTPESTRPDDLADFRMLRSRLTAWIQELPDRRREAFELSRFAGLSLQEIAAVMGISAKTVEQHITHSLKELRRRLNELDPGLLKS